MSIPAYDAIADDMAQAMTDILTRHRTALRAQHDSKGNVAMALPFTAKRAVGRAIEATVLNGDWLNGVTK